MNSSEKADEPDGRAPPVSDDFANHELPDGAPPLVRVRRWLRTALPAFPDDLLGDVLLVCTELVTNAYDHALGPRDVRLAFRRGGRVLRVEVDDGSPQAWPTPNKSSAGPFRGRGLTLVQQIATRWGVLTGRDRKTVWAEFSLNTATQPT